MALDIVGRFPTVPEYYKAYINPKVDLTEEPKQCCPFHKEDTPSFSYDYRTGRWSCFGACHAHGDAIDMHMRWYKLKSRQEAERDLAIKYKVDISKQEVEKKEDIFINKERVDLKTVFCLVNKLASSPSDINTRADRQVELDEVMSRYPLSEEELYNLYVDWSRQ